MNKSIVNKFEISVMTETEKKYKQFCDNNNLTVVFLHQSPNSFSKVFSKNGAKRPDFQHFTEIGTFFVDVKSSKLNFYPKFTLSLEDFSKLEQTQKLLKYPILLAFPIDPWKGQDWGYISLSRVKEIKEYQQYFIEKGYEFIGISYSSLKKYKEIIQLLIEKGDINEN
jgi:peroxiredoxin